MTRERRQFPRILKPFDIQYRRYGVLDDYWHAATTSNLSAGGIRFRSDELLPVSTVLEIQIVLPGLSETQVLRSRVLWHQIQAPSVTEYGVEFLDVTSAQQVQIDRLVQFLKRSDV